VLKALRRKQAVEARSIRVCALLLVSAGIVRPGYAQKPSPAAQVVLVARMHDTFSVHLSETTQGTLTREAQPLAAFLTFQITEHLIPGTTITSACLITKPGAGRVVLANASSPISAREDAADSACDGIFHFNLRQRIENLEHNLERPARKTTTTKNQPPLPPDSRLDIFFSAL